MGEGDEKPTRLRAHFGVDTSMPRDHLHPFRRRYAFTLRRSRLVRYCRVSLSRRAKVGENLAVDLLPEQPLIEPQGKLPLDGAEGLHTGDPLSAACAVNSSGRRPAFFRGRSAARNARTMRASIFASGTPYRPWICAAQRVASRNQGSGGDFLLRFYGSALWHPAGAKIFILPPVPSTGSSHSLVLSSPRTNRKISLPP